MAIMFPEQIRRDAPESERIIFEILKRSTIAREWVVYHSEYTNNPDNLARPREIDFLIFVPDSFAIICLEVKGGSYETIEAGRQWRSTSGQHAILFPPPDKVRDDMFALQKEFREGTFGGNPLLSSPSLISYGCAVALPDGDFPQGARRPIQAQILEARHIDEQLPDRMVVMLSDYAKQVASESVRERLADPNDGDKHYDNALGEWNNLRNYLEYDVTIARDLRTIKSRNLNTLRPQLLRLTEEQIVSLDAPDLNDRCMIDGAAGTGKTILALELARRRCEDEGKSVVLMCSNLVLSSRFERWAHTLSKDNGGSVVVGTPATLPLHIFQNAPVLQAKHRQRIDDASGLEDSLKGAAADERWKRFISETIEDLREGGDFDYLVVDEAQNLCDDAFLELMDHLLDGGLADGQWAMFGDFTNQNLVSPSIPKKAGDTLRARGLNWSNSRLRTNCRNTEEIAHATAQYARVEVDTMSGVYGPQVLPPQYFETEEELGDILDRWVGTWRSNGIAPQQIVLLSTATEDEFKFDTTREYAGGGLINIRNLPADIRTTDEALVIGEANSPRAITYSDVYDFQGLENDVVILVLPQPKDRALVGGDIPWRNPEHLRRVLYTGMSRAKAMLLIVAHEGYRRVLNLLPLLYEESA
ncbi:MAG: DUF2075 domain-containing protein [Chloroflexota bacterium]|nr:DUF2075 domain-containing protein [Chloroflexota bacterium]